MQWSWLCPRKRARFPTLTGDSWYGGSRRKNCARCCHPSSFRRRKHEASSNGFAPGVPNGLAPPPQRPSQGLRPKNYELARVHPKKSRLEDRVPHISRSCLAHVSIRYGEEVCLESKLRAHLPYSGI